MAKSSSKNISFEKSMEELSGIIENMGQADLPLEQALKQFEQGIGIIRHCQSTLKNAEQQVKILLENNKLDDFDRDTD